MPLLSTNSQDSGYWPVSWGVRTVITRPLGYAMLGPRRLAACGDWWQSVIWVNWSSSIPTAAGPIERALTPRRPRRHRRRGSASADCAYAYVWSCGLSAITSSIGDQSPYDVSRACRRDCCRCLAPTTAQPGLYGEADYARFVSFKAHYNIVLLTYLLFTKNMDTSTSGGVVWRSGNGVGHINEVKLRRVRLVLTLVTIFDGYTI